MITPSLCDRRLTFYERQENGADGFMRSVFVRIGTYWGRIDDLTNVQTVANAPQAHVEQRISARATVAEYVNVPTNGYVREGDDGAWYAIRGTVRLRALRALRVDLETIDPTAFGEYVIYEAAEVLDGVHFVTE